MSHHLLITDEAADQLLSEAKWYLEQSQSENLALSWYHGFVDRLETLEQNPFLGGIAPENDRFSFELRELLYGSGKRLTHRALYRISGSLVEVLSIRHHAQRPVEPGDL